jgi:flavin reductase (DIM6/NTAB) family NADH-FMN oxidoreductase RutF
MPSEYRSPAFAPLSRQQFRRYFQPSRIVLGILNSAAQRRVNVITLCFDMHCSYMPPMMAFAVQRGTLSYDLLTEVDECVLSVPGERMAEEALFCGLQSGRDVDKVKECGFELQQGDKVKVPGISAAIANIEIRLVTKIPTGDHVTAFGEVLRFGVNEENHERCLLSVGPDTGGYRVLAQHGIHRLAVVDSGLGGPGVGV